MQLLKINMSYDKKSFITGINLIKKEKTIKKQIKLLKTIQNLIKTTINR